MVQAPQAAIPQPNFVPVSPSTSRRYQSTGIDGSPSNVCVWPLTFRVSMFPSLSKAAAWKFVLPGVATSYRSSAISLFRDSSHIILSDNQGRSNQENDIYELIHRTS